MKAVALTAGPWGLCYITHFPPPPGATSSVFFPSACVDLQRPVSAPSILSSSCFVDASEVSTAVSAGQHTLPPVYLTPEQHVAPTPKESRNGLPRLSLISVLFLHGKGRLWFEGVLADFWLQCSQPRVQTATYCLFHPQTETGFTRNLQPQTHNAPL